MSNRPKISKKKIKDTAGLQKAVSNFLDAFDRSLTRVSTGAYMERNPDVEGAFFIYTPGRKLDLQSPTMLGYLLDTMPLIGEQALIRAVEHANALTPLMHIVCVDVPDANKLKPEQLMQNLIDGQAVHLKMVIDKLNQLNEEEGAIFGFLTATGINGILATQNAVMAASPSGDAVVVKVAAQILPVASPSIFFYVVQRLVLNNEEDVRNAVELSNFLFNPNAYLQE
jgi:hypothetical protein